MPENVWLQKGAVESSEIDNRDGAVSGRPPADSLDEAVPRIAEGSVCLSYVTSRGSLESSSDHYDDGRGLVEWTRLRQEEDLAAHYRIVFGKATDDAKRQYLHSSSPMIAFELPPELSSLLPRPALMYTEESQSISNLHSPSREQFPRHEFIEVHWSPPVAMCSRRFGPEVPRISGSLLGPQERDITLEQLGVGDSLCFIRSNPTKEVDPTLDAMQRYDAYLPQLQRIDYYK